AGVRLTRKIGRERHNTTICWPGCRLERSTSSGAPAAKVSSAGFMLLMKGHSAQAAPIPAIADAAIVKKSRRVAPSCECASIGPGCAVSAIAPPLLAGRRPQAGINSPAGRIADRGQAILL